MKKQTGTTAVRIPGRLQPDEPLWLISQIGADSPLVSEQAPARSFRLGGGTNRGGADEWATENIPDDALVEIEFESGLRFWTSGADLHARLQADGDETGEAGSARGGASSGGEAWDLPVSIAPLTASTRGMVGKLTIKALRWMGLDPVKASVDKLVELAETRSVPREGLFLVGPEGIKGEPLTAPIPDDARVLILLHGTASSTQGSFSKLWERQPKQWKQLRDHYGQHIYAFDHCTLTRSPIENALNVARLLPRKGAVRLLSHSRGGLVGELLCLDPAKVDRVGAGAVLEAAAKDEAAAAARARQKAQFFDLLTELESRPELIIERFVRVACPVIGTSLAGGKLDRWFSLLVLAAIADEMRRNSSRGLLGAGAARLARIGLDSLAELAAAVIGTRKNPDELPGLEAQMPHSPLVRIINGSPGRGDLFIVAGDAEPAEQDWLAELRFGLIDRYFEHDHDLVVDTRAMLDGPARSNRKLLFRSSPMVNHFNYFGNDDSAAAIVAALTDAPIADSLFRNYSGEWPLPDDTATARGLFTPRAVADPPLPGARGIVVLVPGLCGSELKVAGREVWASILALAGGGFSKALGIDNPAVEPGEPLASSYVPLANALRRNGYVVRMHGYDWRKSIFDSVDGLAETLDGAMKDATPGRLPVHAIVHSMGGVLIRATFKQHETVWKRWVAHPQSRVIMLGTPNQGSHAVTLLLTRRDAFFGKLALLDLHNSENDLLKTAQRFPGVLELLPGPDNGKENGAEIRAADTWNRYAVADGNKWTAPPATELEKSGEVWLKLLRNDPLIGHERLIYVAGTAKETPQKAEIVDNRFRLIKTAEGDGRVTWDSGIPPACLEGRRLYYMNAVHGDMPACDLAHPALLELLQKGTTEHPGLSRKPVPVQARGAAAEPGEYAPLGAADASHYPTRSDLLAAATGATLQRARRAGEMADRACVRVIHGDLIFMDRPVMVGHTQGVNSLAQAEYVLDRALNRRMQRRLDAGIYAGALGTYALFPPQPGAEFAVGAIVIGIGRIGELSPGGLADGVTRALVAYAISRAEERERTRAASDTDDNEPLALPVCALLIGAAVGEMSLRDSVAAILRGHLGARTRLAEAGLDTRVRLCELDFVELLEDRAIQALKAARDAVALDGELRGRFNVEDALTMREGGRRRAYAGTEEDAWQRIAINAVPMPEGNGRQLLFDAFSSLARSERLYNGIALASIEQFTRSLIDTESDDEEVGRTLFELLLPHWLKDQAPDRRRAQLVLDKEAAGIPWELLRDRQGDRDNRAGEPLSVRSGLVRQLVTVRFRQQIRRPDGYHALVIGDPDLGAMARYYPSLTGAQTEASSVADVLSEGGYDEPLTLLRSNAEQIQIALYKQDWRVLHLSGHGVYRETLPSGEANATGMLIGDNTLLTAAHIEQMRVVPDFVFINCCSLGRIEGERPASSAESRPGNPMLAANLATQLIEMGVRGVIAAGWRVLDDAAELFARSFYEAFLAGESFGESVLIARGTTYGRFPRSNTWGAYQCYGDPGLLLNRPARRADAHAAPVRYDFVAAHEVLAELERLTLQGRYQALESTTDRKRREERLDALARLCASHDWLARGDIQEAFGHFWGEFGNNDRAIDSYRAAQAACDGSATLKGAEQLVNMLARKADERLRARGTNASDAARVDADRAGAGALLDEAENLVQKLIAIAPTAERYSLLGSVLKRRLPLVDDNLLDQALQAIEQAYQCAEQRVGDCRERLYYPALNVLQTTLLRQLLGTLSDAERSSARSRIDAVRAEVEGAGFQPRDLWDKVAKVDLALTETLLTLAWGGPQSGAADKDFKTVQEAYLSVLEHASQRERASVQSTPQTLLTFLVRLQPRLKGPGAKRGTDLIKRLQQLCDALRGPQK